MGCTSTSGLAMFGCCGPYRGPLQFALRGTPGVYAPSTDWFPSGVNTFQGNAGSPAVQTFLHRKAGTTLIPGGAPQGAWGLKGGLLLRPGQVTWTINLHLCPHPDDSVDGQLTPGTLLATFTHLSPFLFVSIPSGGPYGVLLIESNPTGDVNGVMEGYFDFSSL